MKKHLLLTLAASAALAGVLRADESAPSAATGTAAAPAASAPAAAAPAASAPAAADAKASTPAAVAKNDAPGSVKPGNQLLDAGKYAEAAAYFEGIGEQAAANGATKREPYRQLGLSSAYIQLGKFKEAEGAAQKALDLNKDLAAAWNNLASAQGNLEGRDKAIDTYTKGIAALQADKVDTSKLEANLAYLKSMDKKAAKAAAASASGTAAAPAAAAPAPASPAAAAKN